MWKRLWKYLLNIDDFITVTALSGVLIITIVNVFLRFVVNNPLVWAEEVTLALFVWLIFIGVSSTMKRDAHIGIDYFVRRLPSSLRYIVDLLRYFTIYFVLIIVFILLGLTITIQAEMKVTSVLRISYSYIYISVFLGGLLSLVHLTSDFLLTFIGKKRKEEM
ncbi:TRAP transporter small permease [Gracilibacillus saliphilus]|uniref:TRAP transporter small permease n=1 Tax=Gracilibacillus saliphilus TaxID=543890 RepID=UPI0013D53808|nr:TRAP transporter small permease [Gracilibacillus saliphilus]